MKASPAGTCWRFPRPQGIRPLRRLACTAALLAGVGAACAGDPVEIEPPAHLEVVYEGRAERGLTVVLRATRAVGDTVSPGAARWRVEPADAGAWSGDSLRLTRSGQIRVVAEHEGDSGWVSLDVATPPAILFDMVVGGNRDLYRATLDGGGLERLTTHSAADYSPTIAGKGVVFVSERDGNRELYSLRLDGGAEERLTLTADPELQPALSPDGKRLAFVRGSGLSRLYVASSDASGAVRPDTMHGHGGTLEIAPAWSTDSQRLVFVSTADGNPDLYLWDGGAATFLEGRAAGEFEPAWSPDGGRIAFASNRTGDVELYLLHLGAGSVVRLTEREGSDGQPAWLGDGRIVYVAYTGTTPELRWLDPEAPGVTYPIPLPGEPRNPVAVPQ